MSEHQLTHQMKTVLDQLGYPIGHGNGLSLLKSPDKSCNVSCGVRQGGDNSCNQAPTSDQKPPKFYLDQEQQLTTNILSSANQSEIICRTCPQVAKVHTSNFSIESNLFQKYSLLLPQIARSFNDAKTKITCLLKAGFVDKACVNGQIASIKDKNDPKKLKAYAFLSPRNDSCQACEIFATRCQGKKLQG